jgi:hypothetical protein
MLKEQLITELLESVDQIIIKIEEAESQDSDFNMSHELANQLHEELQGLSNE